MAENVHGLKAALPVSIQGHHRAPYHRKSLDSQIDKLLAAKINNIVEPDLDREPGQLVIDCDTDFQDEIPALPMQNGVRGETISPQAANVVNQVLGSVAKPHLQPELEKEIPRYQQTHLQSNRKERENDRLSENDDNHRDISDDSKQYNHDSRYQFDSSNLSINSDEIDEIDREALEPERETPPNDFSQKLPPTSFSSAFSAEEARLRYSLDFAHADLKERFKQYSAQFNNLNESEWKRRFSQPDTKERVKDFSLNDPISPDSKSLTTSPRAQDLLRGQPRLVDEVDYALTPRVKEGIYFCHLCSFSDKVQRYKLDMYKGSTQADFDSHMTCHFEHVCPHCDYKSRTEGRLKRHIKDFHTDDGEFGNRTMPGRPKVFKCKQCDFSTTEKIDFWTHSRRHIKDDKLLQCPRCPFVTEYKHHLEYHLRNHFGSKPFKCPKCNYACVNKSMLNSHMKSHTNVYQYRCADCTYATKYCHSLKLHLRKYNHKPAAVLNSDGSLPQGMDATASGLSLLSKRGPPRGPRGPRKDKMDPMTGHFLQMGAPPMNRLPQGLPGMMSPYWPMLHNQIPNGMQFPFGLGPRLPGMPPLPSPRENPIIKKEEMSSPPGTSPYKCNFCSFIGNNREVLTAHVVKAHASENQDLFSMFGISSEALLEENQKRMNALKSPLQSPKMFSPHLQLTPGSIKIKTEVPDEVIKSSPHSKQELFPEKSRSQSKDHIPLPAFSFMNGKVMHQEAKDEGIDILKQMTLKFGSGPVNVKTTEPGPLDLKAARSVDSPLDLTKPRYSPPNMYSQQLDSISDDQENRNDEGEHSSGENSTYSSVPSPTQNSRKRSRKGKAFKLDTLCLKLQEKRANGSYESGEESVDDVYSPEPQDDSIENDDEEYYHKQRKNGEYVYKEREDGGMNETEKAKDVDMPDNDEDIIEPGTEKKEDSVEDGSELRSEVEEDAEAQDEFKKIRESISMLNNESEEQNNLVIDESCENGNENVISKDNDDRKIEHSEGDREVENEMDEADQNRLNGVDLSFYNKRKAFSPAIQRGVDIAWKMLNNPFINEKDIRNGFTNYENMKYFGGHLDSKIGHDPISNMNTPGKQNDNSDYMCPHCKIAFGDCIMYTMHMGYHGYKDPYKCNMCGDTCKDRVEFFLHIARAAHN